MCPDSPPDIPAVEVVRAGSSAGGTHVATLRIGSVAGGSGGEVTLDVLLDRGLVDVRIDAADGETARWIAGRSERLVEAIEATGARMGRLDVRSEGHPRSGRDGEPEAGAPVPARARERRGRRPEDSLVRV